MPREEARRALPQLRRRLKFARARPKATHLGGSFYHLTADGGFTWSKSVAVRPPNRVPSIDPTRP